MTSDAQLPTPARQTKANTQFLQQLAQPPVSPEAVAAKQPEKSVEAFDHGLILKQPRTWSRLILWSLLGIVIGGIAWANIAELEEAIPAQGKLEPQGTVKDVQAPTQGVVKTVYVQEGQRVKQGDKLLELDPTAMTAQLQSLKTVRQSLEQENAYYTAQLAGVDNSAVPLRVPESILSLTRSRVSLMEENRYLRSQLSSSLSGLSADQQLRLQYKQLEEKTRMQAAQLQAEGLQRQLMQAQIKGEFARQSLNLNQEILDKVQPLAEQGALSQVQYLKQKQEVNSNRSDVAQYEQEKQRLSLGIQEILARSGNANAIDGRDAMAQIALNDQKIAEIDSQFTKSILENKKRMAEIDSQIEQALQILKNSVITAPSDGLVFELKAKAPGYVANTAEPLLKVVPQESLLAKVSITNKDIGFVKPGMDVDVRVDSFPFSEFGDVKGEVVSIGSDAIEPTQIQPYYTFPAKVKLKNQSIRVNGKELNLQSGMSLSVNIKVRSRKVIDVFTEQFKKGVESLKFVR